MALKIPLFGPIDCKISILSLRCEMTRWMPIMERPDESNG
jgi:hypothetical protein